MPPRAQTRERHKWILPLARVWIVRPAQPRAAQVLALRVLLVPAEASQVRAPRGPAMPAERAEVLGEGPAVPLGVARASGSV